MTSLLTGYPKGCWFGVKNSDRLGVFIEQIEHTQLAACDDQETAGSLSQALLPLLFSSEELAKGCATKPRKVGIGKLDSKRLHAIRGMCMLMYWGPRNLHDLETHRPWAIASQVQTTKMKELLYMWQSQVEIEHYSSAYLDSIAAFKVL